MKKTSEKPPGNSDSDACPSPDMLSAFIEGNLYGRDREWIFHHLRQCRDCYMLVVDSVKLARDLPESIQEDGNRYTITEPLTKPAKKKIPICIRRLGRLQSVALVSPVAAIFLFTMLFKGSPDWRTDEVFDALEGTKDFSVISRSLSIEEQKPLTLGFNRGLSDQKLAFKSGSLLSRLEISRLAGDTDKSEVYFEKLVSLLDKSNFPSHLGRTDSQNLQKDVDKIEKFFLNSSVDFYFKLGLFVESGKAYSLVDKSELFDETYLKALINHPQFDSLPPGVTRRFNEIEKLLDKNTVAQNNEIIYNLLQDIQQILS